jgi:hypothetical protein
MTKSLAIQLVMELLGRSDIVWPKYGNDTLGRLAERIVQNLIDSGWIPAQD